MKAQKHKQKSIISQKLEAKKRIADLPEHFTLSLSQFDCNQDYAADFSDWEALSLLSKALDTLKGFCCSTLHSQLDGKKFAVYNEFPDREKTYFSHPDHVPDDAMWARIHVTGEAVLAGHIVRNTFYLVFLDTNHKFYLTRKETDN